MTNDRWNKITELIHPGKAKANPQNDPEQPEAQVPATTLSVEDAFHMYLSEHPYTVMTTAYHRGDYHRYVSPVFGHRPILAVTREDIQTLADDLTRQRLSLKRIRQIIRALAAAFWAAREAGLQVGRPFHRLRVECGLDPTRSELLYAIDHLKAPSVPPRPR